MKAKRFNLLIVVLCVCTVPLAAEERPSARDLGVQIGIFEPGAFNAITDVAGVLVGHATKVEGDDIRTGVTAIIPGPGNLYTQPMPAWIHSGNGYGKLIGETQVREFGEIETPILLTCTLCVWQAADALKAWIYEQPGMGEHTVNPVVGETNDSIVNDMWANPVGESEVYSALNSARSGAVAEGSIGAGTGTQAFGFKGGIGTSSRVLPDSLGGHTIGVLVQTNFGGVLSLNGAPVGRALGQFPYADETLPGDEDVEDGSIMMVVATDAPLHPKGLERLSKRAMMGLARTGSYASNGSGDYVIAFSTHPDVRQPRESLAPVSGPRLVNAAMSPLFLATVEATEEAIVNALLKATTVTSSRGTLEAIDIDAVRDVLEQHKVTNWDETLPPRGGR